MVEHSCDHGLGLACGGALHLGISLGSAPAQWSAGTVATRWRRTTSLSRRGFLVPTSSDKQLELVQSGCRPLEHFHSAQRRSCPFRHILAALLSRQRLSARFQALRMSSVSNQTKGAGSSSLSIRTQPPVKTTTDWTAHVERLGKKNKRDYEACCLHCAAPNVQATIIHNKMPDSLPAAERGARPQVARRDAPARTGRCGERGSSANHG